jgi:ATP-dependent Lhr-like helicase
VRTAARAAALQVAEAWFVRRGWQVFDFQRRVWDAYLDGASGLIHAPTGTGKTLAAWWGPLLHWLAAATPAGSDAATPRETGAGALVGDFSPAALPAPKGLRILWITPLRALAADSEQSLLAPIRELGLPWTVERRTGDVSSYTKQRQLKRPPNALITTPESLSLLLSQPNAQSYFRDLEAVIVDEWHELLASKRGVQTELCLARLRAWQPHLRTWGLSATLGNLDVAMAVLVGVDAARRPNPGSLVQGLLPKAIVIDSLIPQEVERFPWAGHLGLKMLPQAIAAIEEGKTALVFTNTRSQTESWFQALLEARPDWAGEIALHHGSLAAQTREYVENGLRSGSLRCVVCTSSLDLGVDFSPVDRVLQVGSPKGVARLLQRAGRSGHQPGVTSRVTCVPTHAFELIEAAAVRQALREGHIEGRTPLAKPLDVLVQHLVTVGLGGGFVAEELRREVRTAYAYRDLDDDEWRWALDFVVNGGHALDAYPEYKRLVQVDGRYVVQDRHVAQRHRLAVGTITGDAQIEVRYFKGASLGSVPESFVGFLKPGDRFIFAGKVLELVRVREMTAWVRRASSLKGAIPRWMGTNLPISPELGAAVREQLDAAAEGVLAGPEMAAVAPILRLQAKLSAIPRRAELLIEQIKTRDGYHLFFYPFGGRLVHQGLAALLAYRLGKLQPLTFTITANDYGFELLAAERPPLTVALDAGLFAADHLLDDITASLNASELARRQFREIARVAGLVVQGYPGQKVRASHLQASSNLFYEVFRQYDAGNLLLAQAEREVLERQLEQSRLAVTLQAMAQGPVRVVDCPRPTPFCFPLLVERMQASMLTTESLEDRVRRMTLQYEKWTSPGE